MKRHRQWIVLLAAITLSFSLSACAGNSEIGESDVETSLSDSQTAETLPAGEQQENTRAENTTAIIMDMNGTEVHATLNDTVTAQEFMKLLPYEVAVSRVADDLCGSLCRDDDVMWFRSKSGERDFLHPLSVEGFCLDGLLDYQFRQTSDSSFDLALQLSGKADPDSVMTKLRDGVRTVLNGKMLSYVRFDMMTVDEILPDIRTGKKQLIQTLPA